MLMFTLLALHGTLVSCTPDNIALFSTGDERSCLAKRPGVLLHPATKVRSTPHTAAAEYRKDASFDGAPVLL